MSDIHTEPPFLVNFERLTPENSKNFEGAFTDFHYLSAEEEEELFNSNTVSPRIDLEALERYKRVKEIEQENQFYYLSLPKYFHYTKDGNLKRDLRKKKRKNHDKKKR